MKVYEVVARTLTDSGIVRAFGVMGDANLPIVAALADESDMRYVAASHEGGAVTMAEGYARVSRSVGLALVTHGPGLANALTGVVEAVRNRTPLVVVTGTTPQRIRHFQDLDVPAFSQLAGATYVQVRTPGTAAKDTADAVRTAKVKRSVVVLDVGFDFLLEEADDRDEPRLREILGKRFGLWLGDKSRSSNTEYAFGAADEANVENAAALIASSRRVLIVAGWGAVEAEAGQAIAKLARLAGARLATSLRGKGLFGSDPSSVGIVGNLASPFASAAMAAADLVASFGASLNPDTTFGGSLTEAKPVIMCDTDPGVFGRYVSPNIALLGDARATCTEIVRLLEGALEAGERDPWQVASPTPPNPGVARPRSLHPKQLLSYIDNVLDAKRLLVTDLGRAAGAAWTAMDVPDPRSFVPTVGFGSIGLGLATAIGAASARPSLQTVLATGDGGWAMSFQELATAVRERVNLLIVLFSDGGYGVEYEKLSLLGFHPELSQVDWPDAVRTASAMGAETLRIGAPEELFAIPKSWFNGSGVKLLEVKLSPEWLMRPEE